LRGFAHRAVGWLFGHTDGQTSGRVIDRAQPQAFVRPRNLFPSPRSMAGIRLQVIYACRPSVQSPRIRLQVAWAPDERVLFRGIGARAEGRPATRRVCPHQRERYEGRARIEMTRPRLVATQIGRLKSWERGPVMLGRDTARRKPGESG